MRAALGTDRNIPYLISADVVHDVRAEVHAAEASGLAGVVLGLRKEVLGVAGGVVEGGWVIVVSGPWILSRIIPIRSYQSLHTRDDCTSSAENSLLAPGQTTTINSSHDGATPSLAPLADPSLQSLSVIDFDLLTLE